MGEPPQKDRQGTPSMYQNRPNLIFTNLCWYWENHTVETEGKIGRWIGV